VVDATPSCMMELREKKKARVCALIAAHAYRQKGGGKRKTRCDDLCWAMQKSEKKKWRKTGRGKRKVADSSVIHRYQLQFHQDRKSVLRKRIIPQPPDQLRLIRKAWGNVKVFHRHVRRVEFQGSGLAKAT